ncbi:MAG: class I SAM-dependent methyltransferase [Myxococcales bacterium]|nr:class I SAM-dependent methyltransferase [Myxococcales bacterium]
MPALISAAEQGRLPDLALRAGVRRMVAGRAARCEADDPEATDAFVASLSAAPLALVPDTANEQHYELPPAFFEQVLGPHLKYSGCWFGNDVVDLAQAERAMLERTLERAGVEDGMRVLDLGCGWGSFALFCAEQLPGCRITAVSNSKPQREFILARAAARGVALDVVTADMNAFETSGRFDRVVSVEMFEHMRNWPLLLERIAGWLAPEGRAFVHHFCHATSAYPYEIRDEGDWMARHFFTGGMMPSEDLIARFPEHLSVEERWRVDGSHYQQTADAWLARMDAARDALRPVFRETYGADAERWWGRWRLFFMGCAELFGHAHGQTWFVTHQRLAATS